MSRTKTMVLIHSPLVAPMVWEPVAAELRSRNIGVVIPDLDGDDTAEEPLWWQHACAASVTVAGLSADTAYVLVGHSGAGALLPAIREAAGFGAAGYIFVDAGLPQGDMSPIDGPFGPQLKVIYGSGQRYPNWSDADLGDAIPDRATRQRLLQQVRPQPLRFWKEVIPVFDGWPDAPCGYLRFSLNRAYEGPATEARRRGWSYAELAGEHFHMLVEPIAVTDALLGLSQGR